ncbi:hypothetical protein [Pararhizobium antarcticum]|uniref:hypothetical protein n=1 Tax=Pararhizobium antarcticum TaxID=1798805 RepID=UPI000AF2FA03|nr:hypothetical protein [Pararhizobium antarcticum]
MTASHRIPLSDQLLLLTLAVLTVASLAVAADTHRLCSLFCIHGDQMSFSDICTTLS